MYIICVSIYKVQQWTFKNFFLSPILNYGEMETEVQDNKVQFVIQLLEKKKSFCESDL